VSVIVAGVFRVPPENLAALRPHMLQVMAATRAEAGCLQYAYAEDLAEPGLIRVFEMWTDQAALDAHFAAPHMAVWKDVRGQYGMFGREIAAYDTANRRTL
jgi:quinol monooxygenase YgiN